MTRYCTCGEVLQGSERNSDLKECSSCAKNRTWKTSREIYEDALYGVTPDVDPKDTIWYKYLMSEWSR